MFMDENMFLKNKTCRYKVGTWMNVMDKCLITTAIWDILDNVRILVSYYRPPTTPSLQTVAHWFKKNQMAVVVYPNVQWPWHSQNTRIAHSFVPNNAFRGERNGNCRGEKFVLHRKIHTKKCTYLLPAGNLYL